MQAAPTQNKAFVISGDTYTIRAVQPTDFDIDLTFCKSIPDTIEAAVNFGQKPNPEKLNMFGIYDVNDARSNAFIALKVNGNGNTSKPVGFAMHARNRELYSHEFYISVDQSLKQTSLPAELLNVLVQHAKHHGVKVLFCHADENNVLMRTLAERIGMLVTLEPKQTHGIKYTLLLDKRPDLEKILAS